MSSLPINENISDATISNSSGRNCWKTARERNRLKARYAIRQRVMRLNNNNGPYEQPSDDDDDDAISSAAATEAAATPTREEIETILYRIMQGDRSFFSLPKMEENYRILNEPFSTEFLWRKDDDTNNKKLLLGEQKLLSWFGKEAVASLKCYLSSLETCTFMEYAVWLKRYYVVGSFILGGINPCARGCLLGHQGGGEEETRTTGGMDELSEMIGTMVQRRFFSGTVPINLASYIVKRVVDMRRAAWEYRLDDDDDDDDKSMDYCCEYEKNCCSICSRPMPVNLQLCFGSTKIDNCCCGHVFCELCLWNDVMENMNDRIGDIVLCPVCGGCGNDASNHLTGCSAQQQTSFESEGLCGREERRQESLRRYLTLPIDAKELKASTKRKKKSVNERDSLCSTWAEAVQPSLGLSREVRRDKFFSFVEKVDSVHHVRGCLQSGVDVHLQNEYGQTALFIATWRSDLSLVRLLLHYGSDPNTAANGELTCLFVAKANNRRDIVDLLMEAGAHELGNHVSLWQRVESSSDALLPNPRLEFLIDWKSDHPGAGSFIVDDFLADEAIDLMIELWKTLPIDNSQRKKKTGPCSDRSYFCDATEWILQIICTVLTNAFATTNNNALKDSSTVSVSPHMRFLCYSETGALLAPHLDLSRLDSQTGKRSTHSFLLYLTDCVQGGETALLSDVAGDGRHLTLACINPKRGRLFVFPHRCPHEGLIVEDVPKLLIRGEVWLPSPEACALNRLYNL